MSKDIKDIIGLTILALAVTIIGWFLTTYYIDLPIVYYSVSQEKCMDIIIKGERVGCECLDSLDRYERVWVQ